ESAIDTKIRCVVELCKLNLVRPNGHIGHPVELHIEACVLALENDLELTRCIVGTDRCPEVPVGSDAHDGVGHPCSKGVLANSDQGVRVEPGQAGGDARDVLKSAPCNVGRNGKMDTVVQHHRCASSLLGCALAPVSLTGGHRAPSF